MKQIDIGDKLYRLITEEIHMNAESYTAEEIQEMLVQNGYSCEKLKNELLVQNKCPSCYGDLIHKITGYEALDVRGTMVNEPIYQLQCTDCGFVVD